MHEQQQQRTLAGTRLANDPKWQKRFGFFLLRSIPITNSSFSEFYYSIQHDVITQKITYTCKGEDLEFKAFYIAIAPPLATEFHPKSKSVSVRL
jgi:hypothetical protein